ncbi:MAG: hypothetical protein E4H15_03645 [Syntrophobacterales bacterium]|nr:MAG: hypothetical protein E4H15_03645 [Syntrophobacterales bacterium]
MPEKKSCAIIPAIGGKMQVQARRISVNLQPKIPTSIGSRLTAHKDHPVRKATIVPVLAPVLKSPAAIGKLTYGPPGENPSASAPRKIPFRPDSSPIHFANRSWGSKKGAAVFQRSG